MPKRDVSSRTIFTTAAQLQAEKNSFSCISILWACTQHKASVGKVNEVLKVHRDHFKPTKKEFAKMNMASEVSWWPKVKGKWDNESRILALLLAAEISKDIS